jgi:hypothetical protein
VPFVVFALVALSSWTQTVSFTPTVLTEGIEIERLLTAASPVPGDTVDTGAAGVTETFETVRSEGTVKLVDAL